MRKLQNEKASQIRVFSCRSPETQQNAAVNKLSRLLSLRLRVDFLGGEGGGWKAGCIHLHQKKSFSAFAIVQNEEFQQSVSGGVKRCEEIMGPSTLFTLTWGLPKPVMGMTLHPSLAVSSTHFHPHVPLARDQWSQLWFPNLWRV